MPSWLPHILVPALVALAFLNAPRRTVLAWSPIVFLPDLDYVVQSQHRAVTHSALIPMLLVVALVVAWQRRDPAARLPEFATRPGLPVALTLSAYYIGSHLLMDVFAGGVVLLWPFSYTNFYAYYELYLETGTNTFTPEAGGGTESGTPTISPRFPWISYVDTAILVFLGACAAFGLVLRALRRRHPKPVVVRRQASPLSATQKSGRA